MKAIVNKRTTKNKLLVTVLSVVVVFLVGFFLILPGQSLDEETAKAQGGIDVAAQGQTEDADSAKAGNSTDEDDDSAKAGKSTADDAEQAAQSDNTDADVQSDEPDVELQPDDEEMNVQADPGQDQPAVISDDTVLTFENGDYTVSALCAADTGLPEDTELMAEAIDNEHDAYEAYEQEAKQAAAEALDTEMEGVHVAGLYDISLLYDGEVIEPQAPVDVTISYDEAIRIGNVDQIRIVHFGPEDPEVLETDATVQKKKLKEMTFEAPGFSVYAVVYTSTDELDGKTYGILNNQDTVSGTALMTGSATVNNKKALKGQTMTVRVEPVKRTENVFVAQNSSIQMWTFNSTGDGRFYITTEINDTVKYLSISDAGVQLLDQEDDTCKIIVTEGSGKYTGKYKFSTAGGKMLRLSGGNFIVENNSNNNANAWMNFAELSNLNDDDFVTYTANKVSVSDTENVPDGAQVIIYTRVWNTDTLRYDYYAIDHDGMLVKAYESGDMISWVGSKINTMLWDFTEYHYDDGTPNYYYELQNHYSGKYISPQVSGTGFLSDDPIGLNLNGRRYGEYYSTILAWDDPYYDYASLMAQDGRLISVPMSKAADFYFAIMKDVEEEEELTRVATIDHKPYGITVKMQDYGNINSSNRSQDQVDVLGNTPYHQWTGSPGLLNKNLDDDGYPSVKNSTHSLNELFDEALEVNQQFLVSTYWETGYFEYDSTQNFAHLITKETDPWFGKERPGGGTYEVGDFVVYEQIATSDEGNKDTLKHGQFFPYNDLIKGFDENGDPIPIGISKKYSNEMDIHAQPLSSLDPRKGEALYSIPYKQGKTAPDYVDHFFGMEMSANFMQSENGEDEWGHDLIFEFSGDDDFWFYVDGKLVLDLGGIHSALDGSINFKTGKVIVNGRETNLRTLYKEAYLEENPGADENTVNEWLNSIFKDDGSNTGTVFEDYSGHTLKMFYMERGAGASNIHMRFNLAPYTEGEVQLEKEVSGTDNIKYANRKFPFQIWYKDPVTHQRWILLDDPSKVKDMDEDGTVDFQETYEAGGRTYENVFFLRPDQTASILLPSEDTEYYIKECAMDSGTFDEVHINRNEDPLDPTPETMNARYKDYQIADTTVANRKKVIFDNHVGSDSLKSLYIKKRLWIDQEKTHEVTDDDTRFRFRISIGKDEDNRYTAYSFGSYHVLNSDMEYCVYQNGHFVSTGKTVFTELRDYLLPGELKTQQEQATFVTSQGGAADKIPATYIVEVPGLMDGTPFFVEERADEIPAGYKLIDYELHYSTEAGTVDTHDQSGIITSDKSDQLLTINNRHGYGLIVKKDWSDKPFMKSHDPIYFAVYLKDGNTETLIEDSVRKMTSPSTSYTWFYEDLESGKTLNDYLVYEVLLEGNDITVDENGVVSGYTSITRLFDDDTLEVGGESNDHGYSADNVYTASYSREMLTQQQIEDDVNFRTDTVSNTRAGIKLLKTNMTGEPLAGAKFTLQETGNPDTKKTFTTDEEGLIATAYLYPDSGYTLTEVAAPHKHQALIESMTIKATTVNGRFVVLVNGSETDPANGFYTIYQVDEPTADDMPSVTIKNKPTSLKAVKIDAFTNEPMEGVVFGLYKEQTDYHTGNPIPDYVPMNGFEELVTDENGVIPKITSEDLKAGGYYLREEETPSGYNALGGDVHFTITASGEIVINDAPAGAATITEEEKDGKFCYVMTVKNTPKKAVRILKMSADNSHPPLENAQFALYRAGQIEDGQPKPGEEPLMTGSTDENGLLNLITLSDGVAYYLFETEAPEGFSKLSAPIIITSSSKAVTATLDGAPLTVRKSGTTREVWTISAYDSPGVILPKTGGAGTSIIYLFGGLLVIGAGTLLLRRRKKAV